MLITGDKGESYSWSYCAAVNAFRNNQVLLRLCYSGQDTDTNRHDDNRVLHRHGDKDVRGCVAVTTAVSLMRQTWFVEGASEEAGSCLVGSPPYTGQRARHRLLPNHISLTHTLNRVSLSLSVGVCRESEREGTHTQSKTEYSVFWRGLYQLSY